MTKDEMETVKQVWDKLKEHQMGHLTNARSMALSALKSGNKAEKDSALQDDAVADAFKTAADIVHINLIQQPFGKGKSS